MRSTLHRRVLIPVAAAAAITLGLTGCVGDEAADNSDVDCADYETYGTFDGDEVTISGTIVEVEADRLVESWSDFEACTGISVDYQGTIDGPRHVGLTCGWLGDPEFIDYNHRDRVQRDSIHGFCTVHVLPDGEFWANLIPIIDGRCIVDGQLIKG